jgi:ABC-type uncharacterized transport system permease subunit
VKLFALNLAAMFFYIVATFSRLYQAKSSTVSSAKPVLLLWGSLAVSLHALVLYQNLITPTGFNLGFFNAASLIAWVMALLLLFTLLHDPVENLVTVLFPIAAITIGLEIHFYTERILPTDEPIGVKIHIFFSVLAYSLLTISALQAILLAIQDYQLHHRHPGWVFQMLFPPLQIMEKLLFQLIAVGFGLLSISLITGLFFLEDIFAQHLVHKTVLSVIAWWVFATLLWGHWRFGWRGKTAIRWSLSGFFVLMLAYFGSKLVLELILHRS